MRAWSVLAVSLVLFGCLVPFATADEDSTNVVVLLEDKQYSVGSAGKVTVHVFDKAKHVDADNAPTVEIGVYPTRQVSVSRTSTGVYEGTFTLQSGDLYSGYTGIDASATYGKSGANDTTYNEDSGSAMVRTGAGTSTGLTVDCYFKAMSTSHIKPGTKLTVEAKVAHNGTPVVPSPFSLTLAYDDQQGSSHDEELTTTNPSVGTYQAVYTVPDLSYSTSFSFDASAEYDNDDDSDSCSVSLDFFDVIYHNISKKPTEAVFDLYVADASGSPVSGAAISLSYYPDSRYSQQRDVDAGVTGSAGKARVTLTCDAGTTELNIDGKLTAGGKSQDFTATITMSPGTSTAPTPSGSDFEAVLSGKDQVYTRGQTINRDYVFFNNSKLWTNKEVYCYISSSAYSLTSMSLTPTSVETKTLTTDSSGKARLSVTAPSGRDTYFSVDFESATGVHPKPAGYFGSDHDSIDGLLYSEDSDSFMSSGTGTPGGTVQVTVNSLKIGSPTEVKASAKGSDPPVAMVAWGPGEIKDIFGAITNEADWNIWAQVPSYMTKGGSTYSGSVNIPSFMPKDQKYTVVVIVAGDSALSSYGIASMKPGEGTGATAAAFPFTPVIIVIVVVVVIAAAIAVVYIMRKRRAAAAPMAPMMAPTMAPQQGGYPQAPPAAPGAMAPAPAGYQPPPAPPAATAPPPQAPQAAAAYPSQPTYAAGYTPAPMAAPPAAQPPAPYGPPPVPPATGAPYYPPAQSYPALPQVMATPPPSPIPPPPPSVTGQVTMPNNALCGYCNQWLLQGSPGILCPCGKYYHEACARLTGQCSNCGRKL